jgi:hypothetical protein
MDFAVPVPAGGVRSVVIEYQNDLESISTDISKKSMRVYLLRMASDFRDIAISRYAAGRALILLYTKHEVTPVSALMCLSLLMGVVVFGGWTVRKRVIRSRTVKAA